MIQRAESIDYSGGEKSNSFALFLFFFLFFFFWFLFFCNLSCDLQFFCFFFLAPFPKFGQAGIAAAQSFDPRLATRGDEVISFHLLQLAERRQEMARLALAQEVRPAKGQDATLELDVARRFVVRLGGPERKEKKTQKNQ